MTPTKKANGKTREQRAAGVSAAVKALPAALRAANAEPDSLALWGTVEQLGAIVHRQSRLLAGKPRGG